MALTAGEHRQVQAQTKTTRNAAAKSRRGTLAAKAREVRLYEARAEDGTALVFAVSALDPGRAYILERAEDGAWRCPCFNFRFSVRRTCVHVEAAAAQEGR